MSLWSKITGELIDIIEWPDQTGSTLVYRFERHGNEIKYGAKLIVREGQSAAFVNEGKLADVFAPGMHTLETRNLPVLSTLMGWKYGFESPFKAEVYFVSTRQFTDLKWGTKNPVMMRDAEFGPVRLRAFGTYAVKLTDPAVFLREMVGANPDVRMEDVNEQLRNLIVSRFTDTLGESKIPALDLAANYDELSSFMATRLRPDFEKYGMALPTLLIENISLPPEVEKAIDTRSKMGVIGNVQQYAAFQAADAIPAAAANPGGVAGSAMNMAMGVAMAGQMSQAMAGAAPPPLPAAAIAFHVAIGGQQSGPFDLAALQQQVRSGQLTGETLVWRQGMASWIPAAQAPELASVLGSVPPPLPPK